MDRPLKIILQNSETIIINEDQVCSIKRGDSLLTWIKMSNGEEFLCLSPTYEEWENDLIKRY